MNVRNYLAGISLAITLVVVAVVCRLIPHTPNVTPITALALIGASYFDKRIALVIPFAAMLISDMIIGFHNTILFVYGSFLLVALMGRWLSSRPTAYTILATLVGSTIFFIITNFGVWVMGGYPQTWEGLILCYTMAIPFFRNALIGDLLYVVVLITAFDAILAMLPMHTKTRMLVPQLM
jgi:hypothetical protein